MCPISRKPSRHGGGKPKKPIKVNGGTKTSQDKGNDLESAITEIERLILSQVHGLDISQIEIIPKYKKIPGYEIDLYVKVTFTHGYESIYIFEAKNWKKKVERSDITEFSEKIQVTNAQKGFFIANSFDQGAVTRIKKDEKMVKVLVSKVPNMPSLFCKGSILDTEKSKIDRLVTNSGPLNIAQEFVITIDGKNYNEIEFIDLYIQGIKDHKEKAGVLQRINEKEILINGEVVNSIEDVDITVVDKQLESRVVRDMFFQIEDRGAHYPIHLFDGDEKILEIKITSVKNGMKIYFHLEFNNQFPAIAYNVKLELGWLGKQFFEQPIIQ